MFVVFKDTEQKSVVCVTAEGQHRLVLMLCYYLEGKYGFRSRSYFSLTLTHSCSCFCLCLWQQTAAVQSVASWKAQHKPYFHSASRKMSERCRGTIESQQQPFRSATNAASLWSKNWWSQSCFQTAIFSLSLQHVNSFKHWKCVCSVMSSECIVYIHTPNVKPQ